MNMQRRKRTTLWVVAACLAMLPATAVRADGPTREYQVKAAFIYNFAQFVEWPAAAFANEDAPIVIATLGDDPFRGALDLVIQGKSIGKRSLVVRHFAAPEDVKNCHVLFVGAGSEDMLRTVIAKDPARPVLTVGESLQFSNVGGVIRFYEEGNKLRFEIDPRVAEKCGLKISSKLLKLAKIRS
jgi:preprotein translocase subunit Sec61beta